jgi:hypothetical protein
VDIKRLGFYKFYKTCFNKMSRTITPLGGAFMKRWLITAGFAIASIIALACGSGAPQQTEAPSAAGWEDVRIYLADNPKPDKPGWHRGVLVISTITPYACFSGTCRTWTGTAVTSNGKTVALEGNSLIGSLIQPGDDFYWKAKGSLTYAEDIEVIRHGAVDLRAGVPSAQAS